MLKIWIIFSQLALATSLFAGNETGGDWNKIIDIEGTEKVVVNAEYYRRLQMRLSTMPVVPLKGIDLEAFKLDDLIMAKDKMGMDYPVLPNLEFQRKLGDYPALPSLELQRKLGK